MWTCPGCFKDKELKAFIPIENKGDCEVCGSTDVPRIEVTELFGFFQELIDNFEQSKDGIMLVNKIQEDWRLFSNNSIGEKLLNEILPNLKTKILTSSLLVKYSKEIIDNYSYWSVFKEEIKSNNRFILNIEQLTEELFWDRFFNTQYQLGQQVVLYRARVHHESGLPVYPMTKMGCPPSGKVTSGRANPLGIPVLYLSDNSETVLYETRASYLDEVSIGEFQLKDGLDSIKIVDFTENTNLFQPGLVNETIKSKLLREVISRDLSKPMRRYDTELEYIPTQFICEFIRTFTGADGIRFGSSLHPKGKNVVIFDEDKMVCNNVKLKRVDKLQLTAVDIP